MISLEEAVKIAKTFYAADQGLAPYAVETNVTVEPNIPPAYWFTSMREYKRVGGSFDTLDTFRVEKESGKIKGVLFTLVLDKPEGKFKVSSVIGEADVGAKVYDGEACDRLTGRVTEPVGEVLDISPYL